jgi:hypothetical protein
MFDTYVTRNAGSVHVRVDEHRAPSDDSICLYKELVEKAERQVIEKLSPENELVDVCLVRRFDSALMGDEYAYCFKLNGEAIRGAVGIPGALHLAGGREELVRAAYRALAEAIALKLISQMMGGR